MPKILQKMPGIFSILKKKRNFFQCFGDLFGVLAPKNLFQIPLNLDF